MKKLMEIKFSSLIVLLIVTLSGIIAGCVTTPDGYSDQDKRESIQKMKNKTLQDLYDIHPRVKTRISRSEGYAVFSNVGVQLIFVAAGGGWGIAHDNRTGKEYYMKMASGGIGLGLGVKDFRGVFVFSSRRTFDDFIKEGWTGGVHGDAVAKSGEKGGVAEGATPIGNGIDVYQITESGVALQVNIQGTKFYLDDDLNYR